MFKPAADFFVSVVCKYLQIKIVKARRSWDFERTGIPSKLVAFVEFLLIRILMCSNSVI